MAFQPANLSSVAGSGFDGASGASKHPQSAASTWTVERTGHTCVSTPGAEMPALFQLNT
jgi:hypothetical protein